MAEPEEETVYIDVPGWPELAPPISSAPQQETVRIRLPERPPTNRVGFVPPLAPPTPPEAISTEVTAPSFIAPERSFTPPSGPFASQVSQLTPAGVYPATSVQASPSVDMKKTQPVPTRPHAHITSVTVTTSADADAFDSIPNAVCWSLLGLSVLVLLIQLWNYFST